METETTPSPFGDDLTPEEQAYFESRGESELVATPSETQTAPEPEPDSEPEPEQSEDNEIVIDENGRVKDRATGRFVPHAALHKERTRRQEIEAKYLEAERARASVEGKIEALNQQLGLGQKPAQAEPEAPIDPEEDIFGAYKQQQEMLQRLSKQLEDHQAAQAQTSEFTQIQNAYVQDAVRFNQQTPDFKDAYTFVKEQMHKELEIQGIADANQRESYIRDQEMQLVRQALANGRSPAELIYTLANTRGYKAAPAQDAQATARATEKVQTIKQVQQSATTLTGRGSGSTDAGLTYEQLADMSDDEMFEFAKRSPAAFKKMMSGM